MCTVFDSRTVEKKSLVKYEMLTWLKMLKLESLDIVTEIDDLLVYY